MSVRIEAPVVVYPEMVSKKAGYLADVIRTEIPKADCWVGKMEMKTVVM